MSARLPQVVLLCCGRRDEAAEVFIRYTMNVHLLLTRL